MKHELTVTITAPPEKVWSILSDVERWPEWTKSVQHIERQGNGELAPGSTVRVKQPRQPAMVWRITDLEAGRAFAWEAHSPGVTTRAGHRLTPASAGTNTVVILTLEQLGPLAGLVGLLWGRRTRRYVQIEADGLQRQAEAIQGW